MNSWKINFCYLTYHIILLPRRKIRWFVSWAKELFLFFFKKWFLKVTVKCQILWQKFQFIIFSRINNFLERMQFPNKTKNLIQYVSQHPNHKPRSLLRLSSSIFPVSQFLSRNKTRFYFLHFFLFSLSRTSPLSFRTCKKQKKIKKEVRWWMYRKHRARLFDTQTVKHVTRCIIDVFPVTLPLRGMRVYINRDPNNGSLP